MHISNPTVQLIAVVTHIGLSPPLNLHRGETFNSIYKSINQRPATWRALAREKNHCRIVDHQHRHHHHHRLNTAKGHGTLLCWKVKCIAHNHSESVTQPAAPHTNSRGDWCQFGVPTSTLGSVFYPKHPFYLQLARNDPAGAGSLRYREGGDHGEAILWEHCN